MELNEAASSPITVPSSETNKETDKNGLSSSSDSKSDVTSFGSGQEEFEAVSVIPRIDEGILVDGTLDGPIPLAESLKNSDALVDDDVENMEKFESAESGEKLEGRVEVEGVLKEPRGIGEFGVRDGGTEKVVFGSVVLEVTGTDEFAKDSEVPVASENVGGDEGAKNASLDDRSVGSGVEDKEVEEVKVTGGEESGGVEKIESLESEVIASLDNGEQAADKAKESDVDGTNASGVVESGEVEEVESSESETIATSKNDEQVAEKAKESEVDGILVNGMVESGEKLGASKGEVMETLQDAEKVFKKSEAAESITSKMVEENDLELASESDSIVESIKVDVLSSQPGVAIVGEVKDENMPSEEIDVSGSDTVKLSNGNSVPSEVVEEVFEIGVADGNDKTSEPFPYDDKGEVMETLQDAEKVSKSEADESTTSKMVEEHGLEISSEDDSIIESIKVEVPSSQSGVAIVGEVKDENMPSEEIDVSGSDTVQLSNGNSVTSEVVEEVFEIGVADGNDETSEPIPDYDNEGSESIVAVAGNDGHIILEKVEDDSDGKGDVLGSNNSDRKLVVGINQEELSEAKENGTIKGAIVDAVSKASDAETVNLENEITQGSRAEGDSIVLQDGTLKAEEKLENQINGDSEQSISDEEIESVIFGNSVAKHFVEELEQGSGSDAHSGNGSYGEDSHRIDGQIVTDSDEEEDTDEDRDGREMFDSAALAALLKAATGADPDGGNITISSQDRSKIFSVERPAGLGSSMRSLRPVSRPPHSSIYNPTTTLSGSTESDNNISEEEKKKLEKLQHLRVKFLRLISKLGLSTDESIAAQVLYRLALVAGRQSSQLFNIDAAKRMAVQLEEEGKDDIDFSLNIMVIGKCGVGKSATINSIIGEDKTRIDAFEPATTSVKEISGYVDGVKIRVFDTPGLRSSVMEQAFNSKVLSSVKKITKKSPPDIVLYVDRMDAATRDLNDLPLLKTITASLGTSIWRSTIVTLTHAASAPPDGPSGSPLSYEVFVTQRSHVVQQSIGQAVADLRMMSPSLMNPVSLVENHPSCRKNRDGQKVLPNGQSWKPQLLLLCYSMKILSEANSFSKPQDPFDHRKLFGFRARSPPLPYMLSSMLQSHPHPKLSTEQDNVDSDIDMDEFSDIDDEEEDEYDRLPPFKPLKKAQLARLSSEQKKAYFEEYDYRVKLLQKKQWKEELRRMRETKRRGKGAATDYDYAEEDADSGTAAPLAVPLPDMALPPSFDSDNPAHRYRFLEPTSQILARPVLDTHGWDHDCGYDGVNFEHNLAIASRFPASYTIQITKDKKDFTINVDSAVSAKHGENGSSMAGFDIQSIGKQLAYIVRGETKFKKFKRNKTTGGISITFLGENVVPGVKIEDQIILGKQYALTGSAGAVRSQNDTAYGANFELQRREQDYPIGQVQSTFSLSVIKWKGDLALGFNSLAQFSLGRSSKVTVRAGLNNKLSGQISVRTSSSEHMSLALAAVLPTALAIYRKFCPEVAERYMY